jgi:dolichol-phosphate mannosyltransferase
MTAADTESNVAALVPTPTGSLALPEMPSGATSPVRLSLVIPTYNESKNIRELVARLTQILDGPLPGA